MCQEAILLVEVDQNLRYSILLILQRAGYLIAATDCVNEAMHILQSGLYQLIISDVDTPETRKVLLPKVSHKYPELPILLLTGQSLSEAEKEDRGSHFHYLSKPVDPECILDCIDEILCKKDQFDHQIFNGTP